MATELRRTTRPAQAAAPLILSNHRAATYCPTDANLFTTPYTVLDMMRHRAVPLGVVVLAAFGSIRAGAQSEPRHALPASAPISDIHYDVTVDSTTARTRDLAVTMHFHVAGTKPVVLALPAWSPGHYTLLWFA
ncbi:MAG: hypothetical protein ACREND_01220, partial [Gemmatimonadaceae bacterium]